MLTPILVWLYTLLFCDLINERFNQNNQIGKQLNRQSFPFDWFRLHLHWIWLKLVNQPRWKIIDRLASIGWEVVVTDELSCILDNQIMRIHDGNRYIINDLWLYPPTIKSKSISLCVSYWLNGSLTIDQLFLWGKIVRKINWSFIKACMATIRSLSDGRLGGCQKQVVLLHPSPLTVHLN